MNRKEIEDKLLNCIYGELSPKEMKSFENEIIKYPDLVEEHKNLRKTHEIVQFMEMNEPSSSLMDKLNAEAERVLKIKKQATISQISSVRPQASRSPLFNFFKTIIFHPAFGGGIVAAVLLVLYISVSEHNVKQEKKTLKTAAVTGKLTEKKNHDDPEKMLTTARNSADIGDKDNALKIYLKLIEKYPDWSKKQEAISEAIKLARILRKNDLADKLSKLQ